MEARGSEKGGAQDDRNTGAYRRRLNTSCWMCRKRKVRCDATADDPCTSCKRAGVECRPHPHQLQPTMARRRRAAQARKPRVTLDSTLHTDLDDQASPLSLPSTSSSGTLSRFFEAGIISSNWNGFEENGTFRNVYIGTDTANLHHLVRDNEPPGNSFLCYPFPAIRDELPWKPQPEMIGHHYLTVESINDLSSFPVHPVRDALVETYFKDIHPGFPVIDEAEFRRKYTEPSDPPSLLIFQAVLLAAARITDHPQVAASRAMTTATLYRRAKTLFDLRHESDRVDLIQAALLLAWYTEGSDTVASNAYYWVGNATRIAFGMALHRTASLRYVPPQRTRYYRKYKKIWWMLLYSEVMLALEYGRPCMIRTEDFDVGPLEDEDFKNMDDSEDNIVDRDFCSVLSDISLVALDVISLRAPRGKQTDVNTSSIEYHLAQVALRIPPSHDLWSCQLRLVYNLVVLTVYRTSSAGDAAKLCSDAASNILTTFEAMIVQGTIRQCHQSGITALMGAAIQFAREIRLAAAKGSIITAISAHGQLERLLVPANALSPYFANIEAICRLCKSLAARAEMVIKECLAQHSPLSTSQLPAKTNIDWGDIMTNYRMPNVGFGLDTEDWLNDLCRDSLGQANI
ncbi:fungal-specific transcription factor domain-containing protein [Talaromyces proteolyticus]|uniref:Fungal-specific transcription factor domain-containing protein n=1 Tax=Talaromyces proteolyticus TaxID=1131652 RepID=A0AAD4KVQ7_9EURO|nr:fungal-specific transcription factor domain-containing protein [Talaromyces proteolyticus]KAH8697761.1 fungal-specific transcription factor domain-containing protein [Talaromyces proteolyticus]